VVRERDGWRAYWSIRQITVGLDLR
jgi:hypothetical protein